MEKVNKFKYWSLCYKNEVNEEMKSHLVSGSACLGMVHFA